MAAYATHTTESVPSGTAAQAAAMITRDEVMTAREVADLLRMPTSTVYELARKGVLRAYLAIPTSAARGAARRLMPPD